MKWAELESKEKPLDLLVMKGIFDRYARDIIPKKAPRTQKDNAAELRQLRAVFDDAPIGCDIAVYGRPIPRCPICQDSSQ